MNPCEVLRLGRREDLHVVEVLERTEGACFVGCWVVGEGGDYVEGFEEVAREVGGAGSRCEGEGDGAGFAGVDYGRDGRIEGVGLTPSVYC